MAPRRDAADTPAPVSLERARVLLGREADGMTDAQVLEASAHAAAIARILIQMFEDSRTTERTM